MERIPMTQAGYDKIRAELTHMQDVEMPEITERIATARAEGDLRENAEYHGARESQGMLQAKINLISDKLARAEIIDLSKVDKSVVGFGCTVTVMNLDIKKKRVYTLVGAGEEDYDEGRILAISPLGSALLGKKVGEETEFTAPRGLMRFEILEIAYE